MALNSRSIAIAQDAHWRITMIVIERFYARRRGGERALRCDVARRTRTTFDVSGGGELRALGRAAELISRGGSLQDLHRPGFLDQGADEPCRLLARALYEGWKLPQKNTMRSSVSNGRGSSMRALGVPML